MFRPVFSRMQSSKHAEANSLLSRARRISSLLIVNHLLAAVDAAIFTRLHNIRLDARVRLVRSADNTPLWVSAGCLRL